MIENRNIFQQKSHNIKYDLDSWQVHKRACFFFPTILLKPSLRIDEFTHYLTKMILRKQLQWVKNYSCFWPKTVEEIAKVLPRCLVVDWNSRFRFCDGEIHILPLCLWIVIRRPKSNDGVVFWFSDNGEILILHLLI